MKVTQSCLTLRCNGLYSPWNSPGQNTAVGSLSPGDLPKPGTEPKSPTLQADSLPAEPPRKQRIPEWVAFLSPGDLPDPGIKPGSPALQVDSLPIELSGKPLSIHWLNLKKKVIVLL